MLRLYADLAGSQKDRWPSRRFPMRETEERSELIEQERYEISSFFPDALGSDRRTFLKLFGSGLVVILAAPASLAQSGESGFQRQGARGVRVPMPKDIAA